MSLVLFIYKGCIWAKTNGKVISYLRSSNRDPDKVLKLLKGNQKGKETNYDINDHHALNIIAVITRRWRSKTKARLGYIIRAGLNQMTLKVFITYASRKS